MNAHVEVQMGGSPGRGGKAIRLLSLDLDGTIMVYDDPAPRIHPGVIDLLNELQVSGIAWCINSGRDLPDQLTVLKASQAQGLRHMPVGLVCAESMAYVHQDDTYRPLEPWNTRALHDLIRLHARVRDRLRPHHDWIEKQFKPKGVYVGEHYTAYEVREDGELPRRLFRELEALLAGLPGLMLTRNGPWVAVLLKRLGKGNTLKAFARETGFAPGEILAVGDQYNDLNMLDGSAAHHVGCPENAIPEVVDRVLKCGGFVASRPGPEGTLDVVRHFLGGAN